MNTSDVRIAILRRRESDWQLIAIDSEGHTSGYSSRSDIIPRVYLAENGFRRATPDEAIAIFDAGPGDEVWIREVSNAGSL